MTAFSEFIHQMEAFADHEAMVWRGQVFSFEDLLARVKTCTDELRARGLTTGAVAVIEGHFSPETVSTLLALFCIGAIAVPLSACSGKQNDEFHEIATAEWIICIDRNDKRTIVPTERQASHDLLVSLRGSGHPGLILFTSASTGQRKAAVHDIDSFLVKYLTRRHCYRTLAFMSLDHVGGIDTLFYNLANGSCLITLPERSPDAVCKAIEEYRAEVLPVSPTFINLLLLSGAQTRNDLSSLKIVTYGSEVMPINTLRALQHALPWVKLAQKFGTTETGTMRSKSRASDSVWVKIGGEGHQIRVTDGLLEIKSNSGMLGYLNAPPPFTSDGWFKTGDAVDVDGEYMRILGRKSQIINIGGEKVHPAEVENIIQEMEGIAEVTVFGETNPITGKIVCARLRLARDEEYSSLVIRVKKYCREHMAGYKVPVKIYISDEPQHNARFKKSIS